MAWRKDHPEPEEPPRHEQPTGARGQALDELAYLLEDLHPLRGLAHLQRLCDQAEELLEAIDDAAGLAWALGDELDDVQDEMADLEDHKQALQCLADLDWHSDDFASLSPLVQRLRHRADDLRLLAEEFPTDGGAA